MKAWWENKEDLYRIVVAEVEVVRGSSGLFIKYMLAKLQGLWSRKSDLTLFTVYFAD